MPELLYIKIVFLLFRLYNADWQCTSTDFRYKMDGEVMIIDLHDKKKQWCALQVMACNIAENEKKRSKETQWHRDSSLTMMGVFYVKKKKDDIKRIHYDYLTNVLLTVRCRNMKENKCIFSKLTGVCKIQIQKKTVLSKCQEEDYGLHYQSMLICTV